MAEQSRKDYCELLVKHRALRQELDTLRDSQQTSSVASMPYIMVLVDGHSHKVRGAYDLQGLC